MVSILFLDMTFDTFCWKDTKSRALFLAKELKVTVIIKRYKFANLCNRYERNWTVLQMSDVRICKKIVDNVTYVGQRRVNIKPRLGYHRWHNYIIRIHNWYVNLHSRILEENMTKVVQRIEETRAEVGLKPRHESKTLPENGNLITYIRVKTHTIHFLTSNFKHWEVNRRIGKKHT